MRLDRDALHDWFPVYLRYLGSLLAVVLVFATIFGAAGIDWAPAWIGVTGMILYKTVDDLGRSETEEPMALRTGHTIEQAALDEGARLRRRRGRKP